MFDTNSRYYPLPTGFRTLSDGRIVAYKLRRFLPRGEEMEIMQEFTVSEGDRLDQISAETLGDPEFFWRICDANETMYPFDLVAKPGERLKIPLP
jgi:hypothetical protein